MCGTAWRSTCGFEQRSERFQGIFPNWLNHTAQFSMPLRWGEVERPGLLLRNHVETFLEFLKKSESDSEFH